MKLALTVFLFILPACLLGQQPRVATSEGSRSGLYAIVGLGTQSGSAIGIATIHSSWFVEVDVGYNWLIRHWMLHSGIGYLPDRLEKADGFYFGLLTSMGLTNLAGEAGQKNWMATAFFGWLSEPDFMPQLDFRLGGGVLTRTQPDRNIRMHSPLLKLGIQVGLTLSTRKPSS